MLALLLKDFAEIKAFKDVADMAKEMAMFIYNHQKSLELS